LIAAPAVTADWRSKPIMTRYGMVNRIRAGCEEVYRRYHAEVWPEVLEMIQECNISNYSIYWKDDLLFGYFEYHGDDFEGDMARMAAHPRTQEWWALMEPMQNPVPSRKQGEWWAAMQEVFHLD